jgi:AcrR family transcriptional regulator
MDRRLTQRGRERRHQLMTQAAVLFADRGYHPTSVADIVDALGVGKGVFYWYFPSKEELFVEILRDAQYRLRKRQQAEIGDEPDPILRIEKGLYASMRWLAENRQVFNLFQFAATESAFAPALRHGNDVSTADAMRHVKDAITEGRVRDGDPLLLTQAILGVTNQLARRCILEGDDDPDEVAAVAVHFCLHGLTG